LRSLAGAQNPLFGTGFCGLCTERTDAIFGLHCLVKSVLTFWAKVKVLVSNWQRRDLIGHRFAGGALYTEQPAEAMSVMVTRLFALRRQQNARAIQRESHGMITKL
jgi:hypothetical protein